MMKPLFIPNQQFEEYDKQLLPCPFCGSKCEVWANGAMQFSEEKKTIGYGYSVFGVRCTNCNLDSGPRGKTPEAAIKFWNTRSKEDSKQKSKRVSVRDEQMNMFGDDES